MRFSVGTPELVEASKLLSGAWMGQTEICRRADQMLRTNSEAVTQNGTLEFPLAVGLTTAAAPLTQQLADGRRAVVCTWRLPITSVLGTSLRNKVIHHNLKQLDRLSRITDTIVLLR